MHAKLQRPMCTPKKINEINENLAMKTKWIQIYNSLYLIFNSSVHFLNAYNLYHTIFSTCFFPPHLFSVATDDHVLFERNAAILDSIIVKKFVAVYPHTGNYHLSIRKDNVIWCTFFPVSTFKKTANVDLQCRRDIITLLETDTLLLWDTWEVIFFKKLGFSSLWRL